MYNCEIHNLNHALSTQIILLKRMVRVDSVNELRCLKRTRVRDNEEGGDGGRWDGMGWMRLGIEVSTPHMSRGVGEGGVGRGR